MLQFFKISPERLHRVMLTLKQAAVAVVLSAAIALLGNVTDILKLEFGQEVWWPVLMFLFTGLSSYLMHLRQSKKG